MCSGGRSAATASPSHRRRDDELARVRGCLARLGLFVAA